MELRVQRQSDNAKEIAKRLEHSEAVESIIYPGLKSHDQHEIALKQQANPDGEPIFGSMLSLKCGTTKKRDEFLSRLRLFTLAESLGGVESLSGHPASMTHASIPKEEREKTGIVDSFLISVTVLVFLGRP